ncbi:MAG: endonuclease/exonuclease/phosphatase family protein, partial [Thiovulaceae bacterium]|nr:endonuclease/exonuclease/phosphatase family protein [Sulfurimonadaceae bacterium]
MNRVLLFVLFLATLLTGEEVKIATYNVENLFDMAHSGHEYAEYIPNTSWKWNSDNYRKKLKNIAKVIVDMDPDIIALQEIESLQALKDLKAQIQRDGLYLPYYAIASAKETTVKVALLSKHPLHPQELRVTASYKYRNILEAKVQLGSEKLYLFVNHWKSKSGPESRRVTSAKVLKERLTALGDINYVLIGDFNSDYRENESFVRKRKFNDTDGITGINNILKTTAHNEAVTLEDLKRDKDYAYNLWYELPKAQRWSHKYRGNGEGLDSIIISPKLADGKGIEYKQESFHKFDPPYLFRKGYIYRWQRSRKHPKHHTGKGY